MLSQRFRAAAHSALARNDAGCGQASSLIRTITVGSGISPDLLTSDQAIGALAGSSFSTYRRWGIAPRPEDAVKYSRSCVYRTGTGAVSDETATGLGQGLSLLCPKLSMFQSTYCRGSRLRHRQFRSHIESTRGFALMREAFHLPCPNQSP